MFARRKKTVVFCMYIVLRGHKDIIFMSWSCRGSKKNVSKSVLHEQNWLFCLLNLLLFLPHCVPAVVVVVAKAPQIY